MATLKLGSLIIRTLAKPVANSLKNQTKNSETFKGFCISIAQSYHRIDMNLKMKFLGYERERIRPLSDSRAVELGSNFLSEFLIFSVAASIIGYEAYRSNKKASERRDFVDEAILDFKNHYDEYINARQLDEVRISELRREIKELKDVVQKLVEKKEKSDTRDSSTEQGTKNKFIANSNSSEKQIQKEG